jgi:DNA-directed RNA polymerase specialized sigma24 family protein
VQSEEDVLLNPEIFRQLQSQDWGNIGKALTVFGIYWARRYSWRTGDGWDLAKGSSIEDIVQTVIGKTFDGTRHYDPNLGELLPWLKDQVKSEIDALFNSASHRNDQPVLVGQAETDSPNESPDMPARAASAVSILFRLSPEELTLRDEAIRARVDAIFAVADNDPDLVAIVEAIMDGCSPKSQALADRLGLEVKEVYVRTRRLRRRATKKLEDQNDTR